jgi:hypothetical protein
METAKNTFFKSSIVAVLFASGTTAFAIPPSAGQLVIINGLDNTSAANSNSASRSNIMVQVFDTHTPTSPCYTVGILGYNNVAIIPWQAAGVHSVASCAGTGIGTAAISKIEITPLSKLVGDQVTIVYDATVDASVPKTTASPITLMPPTTIYENMTLIINGSGIPNTGSQTANSTNWGFTVTPTSPVFNTGNGNLMSTGVPGVIGASNLKAEKLMRRYGVIPYCGAADSKEPY